MARGARFGAMFLWLACGGCGSSTPASQQDVSTETGQDITLTEASLATPHSDGNMAGAVSAWEAPPSLPEPTCIPSQSPAPPVEAQACAVSTVWADGRSQLARYDPDGRLLELRTNDSGGALLSVETHLWQNGIERQRRVSYAGGAFTQTDWSYDEQGRLIVRVDQGSQHNLTEYEYNDQGLLGWSYTWSSQGEHVANSDYSYDAQGHLTEIASSVEIGSDCDLEFNRCETRSYWPGGQLRQRHWSRGYNWTFSEDYNELGQLIGSTWANGSGGDVSNTTYTYDSAGRVSRSQTWTSKYLGDRAGLTTTVYEPGGWRERFAEDSHSYPLYPEDPSAEVHTYYQRITHRAHFFCGTSTVALEEWDNNEDGIVDAQRTHERDAMGRRVRERYSGTPGMDEGPVSRDFSYECP